MTLFVTKNGQQLGPYSLEQVQDLVADGTLVASDWAWYEGQADWVQLAQVPGFILPITTFAGTATTSSSTYRPRAERPIAVWIVCLFYFICFPIGLLGLLLFFAISNGWITIPMPEAQQRFYASQNFFDYGLTICSVVLNLAWAVQLFRLKRQALYLYIASISLGILAMTYNIVAKNWIEAAGTMGIGIACVIWVLNFTLLWYIWYLSRKDVLR